MIQRLQSIFYLLASGSFFSIFAFPFASSSSKDSAFFSDLYYNTQDHIALLVITILGGILALAAIFLYRNRGLQMKMGIGTAILSLALPIVAAVLMINTGTSFDSKIGITPGAGAFLPLVALIFSILANRYVNKDEKLVKSMDRLR